MKKCKTDCFAIIIPKDQFNEKVKCTVFGRPKCDSCTFYKKKSEVKNNIFYRDSFKTEEEYQKALKEYEQNYGLENLDIDDK